MVRTRLVASKTIFACKQTRDKQDGGIILSTMYMLQRNMMKFNCHRLKYLVLYYKRVIALILRNVVRRSISYRTRKRVLWYTAWDNIYIIIWSCPGNMPKYYPGLRDILPNRRGGGWVICLSDLGNILAYYLDKTTLISLLYWVSNCPGNMPKYYSTKYHYRNLHEV